MNPVSLAVRNGCLILAVSVGFASPGLAATEPAGGGAAIDEPVLSEPQPQPWGTTSDTALVVGASDITPPLDGGTLTYQTYAVGGGIGSGGKFERYRPNRDRHLDDDYGIGRIGGHVHADVYDRREHEGDRRRRQNGDRGERR